MPKFRNPTNGHVVHVDNLGVVLGAFFFGPIIFFCIGEVGHGLANFGMGVILWMVLLGWLVWIGYAIAGPDIVRQKWLIRGYEEENY